MKTIFITGSTDGIGKLTAIKLAKDNHEVILHGRNSEKLQTTIDEVKAISKNENIKGFIADFSSFESLLSMTEKIKQEISKIDVLINNTGVFNSKIAFAENGFEIRFMVNYFAPFLLTKKLLPIINNSEEPRIINLSSAAQAPLDFDALKGNKELITQNAYAQSKLALTMWSFYLANQYESINTIAVNPGSLLNTKMVQEAFGQFWSSADKGANILYDLAISEKHANSSGKYFDNDKGIFANAHPDAYKQNKIDRLIETTNALLNF